jgi:NADH-quinone oxidoreductase subunit E
MIDETMNLDLTPLDEVLEQYAGQKGAVIPILQHAQEIYGYLPKEILAEISKRTAIPLSRLVGVATFYAQFRLTRRGKHLIRVCDGTGRHVRGARRSLKRSRRIRRSRRAVRRRPRVHHGDRSYAWALRPGAGGGGDTKLYAG